MEISSIMTNTLSNVGLKRKSTSTNPFEKNSFKGRTFKGSVLPFADVFQAIKPLETAKPNKVKMMAGAVIAAVTDFKTRLGQPIALFAHKVRESIAHGVDSVRNAKNSIKEMSKSVHEKISHVLDFHKPEAEIATGPKILDLKHINKDASVKDLKATWVALNEKVTKESGKVAA